MQTGYSAQPGISVMTTDGRTAVIYNPHPDAPAGSTRQVQFAIEGDDLIFGQTHGAALDALPAGEIEHLAVAPSDGGGYSLVTRMSDGGAIELLAGIPNQSSAAALGRALEREFGLTLSPIDKKAMASLREAKKPRSKWQIIWSGLGVVIVLILAASFLKVFIERPKVEKAIDELMKAMQAQDPEGAYSMLASRTKNHSTSLADIEDFTREYRPMLQAYQSVSIYEMELQRAFATDPSLPQGTIANVWGEIAFTNGIVEPFTATLEKEDGEWRIFGFFIGPPPDEGSP